MKRITTFGNGQSVVVDNIPGVHWPVISLLKRKSHRPLDWKWPQTKTPQVLDKDGQKRVNLAKQQAFCMGSWSFWNDVWQLWFKCKLRMTSLKCRNMLGEVLFAWLFNHYVLALKSSQYTSLVIQTWKIDWSIQKMSFVTIEIFFTSSSDMNEIWEFNFRAGDGNPFLKVFGLNNHLIAKLC